MHSAAISVWLTASHSNSEVKQVRAGVVLRWGTTREGPVLLFSFSLPSFSFSQCPFLDSFPFSLSFSSSLASLSLPPLPLVLFSFQLLFFIWFSSSSSNGAASPFSLLPLLPPLPLFFPSRNRVLTTVLPAAPWTVCGKNCASSFCCNNAILQASRFFSQPASALRLCCRRSAPALAKA